MNSQLLYVLHSFFSFHYTNFHSRFIKTEALFFLVTLIIKIRRRFEKEKALEAMKKIKKRNRKGNRGKLGYWIGTS